MARLIPTILPSEIRNSGERKLAEVLVQHLPSRVDIYHGFQWRTEVVAKWPSQIASDASPPHRSNASKRLFLP